MSEFSRQGIPYCGAVIEECKFLLGVCTESRSDK